MGELPVANNRTKNAVVYCLSDPHFPYHHIDSFDFHRAVKKKYRPDRIICLGDELDNHKGSYHEHIPDLPSWEDELQKGIDCIRELESIFPKMDVMESNHGSLWFRKASTAGLPRRLLKSYEDVMGTKDWKWHFDLTIKLSNGQPCYFHHSKSADILKASQALGMCAVFGHHHNKFDIRYWGSSLGLFWGMQLSCMADKDSLAQSYGRNNLMRPIVGNGIIINGQPKLLPMVLNKRGRWDREVH